MSSTENRFRWSQLCSGATLVTVIHCNVILSSHYPFILSVLLPDILHQNIPLLTIALETVLPPASSPPLTPPFELPRDIWQIVMEFFYRQSAEGWCMAPISVAGAPAAAESLLVQPQPWEPRTKTWWGELFNSVQRHYKKVKWRSWCENVAGWCRAVINRWTKASISCAFLSTLQRHAIATAFSQILTTTTFYCRYLNKLYLMLWAFSYLCFIIVNILISILLIN